MEEEETAKAPAEDPYKVQAGDLVRVHFTVSLEDGRLIRTSREDVMNDPAREKPEWFDDLPKADGFGPQETVAGDQTGIPGVPGLQEAVLGMKEGERKQVVLPPDKAYGKKDERLIKEFDCVKRVPRIATLTPEVYTQTFQSFPMAGREVSLTPYFKSRVVEVTENYAKLEAVAEEGRSVTHEYGTTVIQFDGDEIVLALKPRIGAPFVLEDKKGKITLTDDKTFTVDFNHPLQGETVVVETEIVSLEKASRFKDLELAWIEDHDKGLDTAQEMGKPVVLVLYSPTCSWSSRLLTETLEDPRIKQLKDDFVWVKVDSLNQHDLYAFYEQDGYPLTVLLGPEGEVMEKLGGYRPPAALKMELKKVLEKPQA